MMIMMMLFFENLFLKLINAILDVGKGIITIEVDGNKHEFDFLPRICSTSPQPLDNKEVESSCCVDSFRDPLQQALEGESSQDEQDQDLADTTEGLNANIGILEEENSKT